jgi:hypothetical protein
LDDDFVVLEHAEVGVTVTSFIARREIGDIGVEWPHIVGVGEAEVFVEAMAQREKLGRVAKMPFAKNGGSVAALFDELGESHFVVANPDFGAWAERAVDTEAIWVAAGEQTATGSGADGLRDVEIAEDAALRRKPIEIWSHETFCAEHSDVRIALIVGEDDDYVRELSMGDASSECLAVEQPDDEEESKGQFMSKRNRSRPPRLSRAASGTSHADIGHQRGV